MRRRNLASLVALAAVGSMVMTSAAIADTEPATGVSVVTVDEFNAAVSDLQAQIDALETQVEGYHPTEPTEPTDLPTEPAEATTEVSALAGDGSAILNWDVSPGDENVTGVLVGRDGTDTAGNGPWSTTETALVGSRTFDKLVNGTVYTLSAELVIDGVASGRVFSVQVTPQGTTTPPDEEPPPTGTSGQWVSGMSGYGAHGPAGDWRGRRIESATTWADSQDACQNQWAMQPGGEYDWMDADERLVVAIGGKWGQSWSQAATGGLDSIWRTCLTAMKTHLAPLPEQNLTISLFHESNGNWYDWSVTSGDLANFKAAFARFHDLQEEILPEARLALVLNADHVQGGYTPEQMLPDPADYDILGIDIYSMHYPAQAGEDVDDWVARAAAVGKPVIVQEWAVKENETAFIDYMRANFEQHGGTGPGHIEVENYFNLWDTYQLYPTTQSPDAAQRYVALW